MTPREKKTADELSALVMLEIRKHLEWNHITSAAISRPVQRTTNAPNWDVMFGRTGRELTPNEAFEVVRGLQAKYELV